MPEPRSKLPKGLPQPLVDFARCRTDRVDIAPGELGWLPKPKSDLIPDVPPSLSMEQGEGGSVDVTAGWGLIGVTMNVSVVDGNVTVTTKNPLIPKKDLRDFQDNLNADLHANGKAFDKIEIVAGKLRMTKRLLAAPATSTAPVTPATVTPPAHTPKAGPSPTPAAQPAGSSVLGPRAPGRVRRFVQSWQGKAGITTGALVLGAAAFYLFTNGDDAPAQPPALGGQTGSGQPAGGQPAGGQPGSTDDEVGALPRCDATPTDGELAAVRQGDSWGGRESGVWPAVAMVLDPRFHVPCEGAAGTWRPLATDGFQGFFPAAGVYLAGPGALVINHSSSVPDAVTGEVGLSMDEWGFPSNLSGGLVLGRAPSFFEYACSGKTITGSGTAQDGLVTGSGPLFQFGPCTATRLYTMADGREIPFAQSPLSDFVVGPEEGSLDLAAIEGPWLANPSLAPDSLATLMFPATLVRDAMIATTEPEGSCVWFASPDPATGTLQTVDCHQWGYWRFPAFTPQGNPGAIGSGGPQVVASGFGTTDSDFAYQGLNDLLFANTLFPCGPGRVAYTVCAAEGSAVPEGPWTLAQVVLAEPLALQPVTETTIGIGFDQDGNAATGDAFGAGDAGGVEVEYRITGATGGTWVLARQDGAATTARALITENSLTLVVPSSELGTPVTAYRTYALADGAGSALPAVGTGPMSAFPYALPVVNVGEAAGSGETTTSTTIPPADAIAQFLEQFNAATAGGDVNFLMEHLHPAVFSLYDEAVCRSFVEREILPLTDYQLTGDVTGPTTVTIGGQQVSDYYTALVSFVISGQAFNDQPGTFAVVDGEVYWFTQCS